MYPSLYVTTAGIELNTLQVKTKGVRRLKILIKERIQNWDCSGTEQIDFCSKGKGLEESQLSIKFTIQYERTGWECEEENVGGSLKSGEHSQPFLTLAW